MPQSSKALLQDVHDSIKLGQDDSKVVSTIFDAFIRGTIRNTFIDIMADEVSALCGAAYDRSAKGACRRAGSALSALETSGGLEFVDSRMALNAKSILIPTKRLKAYKLSRFEKRSSRPNQTGTPSREVQEGIDWNKGASSSEVSRVWAKEGAKRLLELKNRRFDDQR